MKQGMNMGQHWRQEREMPLLAGIGALVTWCEELLAILSGPILTAGLALALIDLLTDGQLLARLPALLYVWAASQAIGLDAQFIGAAAKLARAIRRRAIWPMIGYAVLCLALGYVGYLASNVFATQEANGITTAEALARLGMDSTSWIVQRSLLAVTLVFLSGFLRYVAPTVNSALSAEDERAKLEADLMLEPLRQQLRAQQARGMRGVVVAALGREVGRDDTQLSGATIQAPPQPATATEAAGAPASSDEQQLPDKPTPPTGPRSPKGVRTGRHKGSSTSAQVIRLTRTPQRRQSAAQGGNNRAHRLGVRTGSESVEEIARAAWRPGMTVTQLQHAAGISRAAAGKYRRAFIGEAAASVASQQRQHQDQEVAQ